VPFEIVPHGTNVDFIGRRHLCAVVSAVLIIAGIGAVFARGGVPMGIDFRGGTEVQLLFDEGIDVDEAKIRAVVDGAGIENATVVRFGGDGDSEFLVKFPGDLDSISADEASGVGAEEEGAENGDASLSKNDRVGLLQRAVRGGIGEFKTQRVEFVGPRVGAELREDGATVMLMSAIAILIYVAFRFSIRFAPGAVVAVIHDLTITGGILVMLGIEFDLRILAAMLAILGYSLNDTIIIYDRIRENMEVRTKADFEDVLNTSVNQTLSRTFLTSITTMLALLSLYFLGGDVIKPFALAMLIGVVVGTYSSIFIASPLLLFLEKRYGEDHS
jgi:preprotein translocase subunit SecF